MSEYDFEGAYESPHECAVASWCPGRNVPFFPNVFSPLKLHLSLELIGILQALFLAFSISAVAPGLQRFLCVDPRD